MTSLRVVPDATALAQAAAAELVRRAREAVEAKGAFYVALSGGRTPRSLYRLLGGEPAYWDSIPWSRVYFFMGDERRVPPDHPESNYRMVYDELFSRMPVRAGHVWRFWSEGDDVEFVASYYEEILRGFFRLPPGQPPRFDLLLLGLGEDGHTASLFPGSPALDERNRLAAAPWVEKLSAHRFTLTPPVLNRAASVIFLVSGAEKAQALRDVMEGERDPARLPAQVVRPQDGTVLWLVDRAAASRLSPGGPSGLEAAST